MNVFHTSFNNKTKRNKSKIEKKTKHIEKWTKMEKQWAKKLAVCEFLSWENKWKEEMSEREKT